MVLVEKARTLIPDVGITTDILVGFPGETEDDFQATCDLMETIRFDEAYTYRYSHRDDTPAAKMSDHLTDEQRLKRLDRIIRIQRRITREKRTAMIGSMVEVIPEATSRQSPDEWMGRTDSNHIVVFSRKDIPIGRPTSILITDCRGSTLRGIVKT